MIITALVAAGAALALMQKKEKPAQQAEHPLVAEPRSHEKNGASVNRNEQLASDKRIKDSFDSDAHDDIAQYIDWLRSAIDSCVADLRRMLLFILLLVAVFEVVLESPSARISLGSFEIVKGSVVLLFIPALVAYMYLEVMVGTARLHTLRRVFRAAFARWSDKGGENDLDVFINPAMPLYWYIAGDSERKANQPRERKIEILAAFPFMMLFIVGVIAFEYQAYHLLRNHTPGSHILWIISGSVSAFCVIMGFIYSAVWAYTP
jgi:hypothetical protein